MSASSEPTFAPCMVRVFGEAGAGADGELRPDFVATAVPVALVFNGIAQAVMMASPEHLEDFALVFALSEGILDAVAELHSVSVRRPTESARLPTGVPGFEVHLDVSARSFARLKERRRTLAGRTGCGVGTVESLAALELIQTRLAPRAWVERVNLTSVLAAFDSLDQ